MLIQPLSPSSAAFHLKIGFAHLQVAETWEFSLLTWHLWNLTTPSEPEPKPPSLFPPTDSCFQLWGTNPCAFLIFFSLTQKTPSVLESPNDIQVGKELKATSPAAHTDLDCDVSQADPCSCALEA